MIQNAVEAHPAPNGCNALYQYYYQHSQKPEPLKPLSTLNNYTYISSFGYSPRLT